jgi:hypothetical protein
MPFVGFPLALADPRSAADTEDERYAVADHVVRQLQEHGDLWKLDDETKPGSTPTRRYTRRSVWHVRLMVARYPSSGRP